MTMDGEVVNGLPTSPIDRLASIRGRSSNSVFPPTRTIHGEVVRFASVLGRSSDSVSSPTATIDGEVVNIVSTSPIREKQVEDSQRQPEDSGNLRERFCPVFEEIETITRRVHHSLLLHESELAHDVLEKAKGEIVVLRELFGKLAEIFGECPGQYYRYYGDWRSKTRSIVSLLAFMHWLETEKLLLRTEAEEKLGLRSSDFGLGIEDYLIGISLMSNELPRYVKNRVVAGDYDCLLKALNFFADLRYSFRLLNMKDDLDFLREKFDGIEDDLRAIEDVYHDVVLAAAF